MSGWRVTVRNTYSGNAMSKTKILVLLLIVASVGGFLLFGPRHYLSLEFVQSRLDLIQGYREANPGKALLMYAIVYILVTAASIPGALVLTLVGGAIFGFAVGSLVVVVSATIGATIAFLLARYLFGDLVASRMGERLGAIRENLRREGALYLFSMRLVPVFPFFAVNLLMGLTPIRTLTYSLVSLVGMAPGSMVFVNAGTQLARLESVKGLLSPTMIASFTLLGVFPYVAKYFLRLLRKNNDLPKDASS